MSKNIGISKARIIEKLYKYLLFICTEDIFNVVFFSPKQMPVIILLIKVFGFLINFRSFCCPSLGGNHRPHKIIKEITEPEINSSI